MSLDKLTTEGRNTASESIDTLSAIDIVRLINDEDATVATAVQRVLPAIAQAVEVIADRLRRGGRLIYTGAGTSGRLGVLDAAECPPTFSTPHELVVGLIAGGHGALLRAVEGAEDSPQKGADDLRAIHLGPLDVMVGIATSGRTPYVIGGLKYAQQVGAYRIGLACNDGAEMATETDLMITPVVGPEVISGSTRMKAGTATKMVLNMLTTATMVLIGKTYGNLMVDLKATNFKLKMRTRRIVCMLTGLDEPMADEVVERCNGELKTAIVSQLRGVSAERARQILSQCGGHLRTALQVENSHALR